MPICPVCKDQQAEQKATGGDFEHYICLRCGEYKISGSAIVDVNRKTRNAVLSSFIREQNELKEEVKITTYVLERIAAYVKMSYLERANTLLLKMMKSSSFLKDFAGIVDPAYIALTHSEDKGEVRHLAEFLVEQGYLVKKEAHGYRLTGNGMIHAEELSTKPIQSSQGFIAMWFSSEMDGAYKYGLHPAIKDAGYVPNRVDKQEHNNKIDDEIISSIRRSKFVVVDFTGHRGGVYFEAGFALGLAREVFWTCKKSDIAGLHFDIRQYNWIDWDTPEELRSRLATRITALLGDGPHRRAIGAD